MYKNDLTFSSKCITVNYQYHFSILLNSYIGLLHYYVKIISKQFSQFQTISNWGKTVSNKFQARFQHNTLPRLMRYIDIFDKLSTFQKY